MRTSRRKTIFLNAAAVMLASVLLLAVASANAQEPAKTSTLPSSTVKDAASVVPTSTGKKRMKKKVVQAKKTPTTTGAKSVPVPAANKTTRSKLSEQRLTQLSAANKIAPTMKIPVAPPPTISDLKDNGSASLQASVKTPSPIAPKKRWSFVAALQRSHNIYEEEMGERKELDDFLSDITYKLSDNFTALSEITWERDTQSGESDFGDTIFQISRKGYGITKSLTLGPKIHYIAPTSKKSQDQQSHGAFGAGLTLGFAEGVLPAGLTLLTDTNLTAFNQEYQTTEDGKILNQYSSRQRILYEYDFSSFEISGAIYHKSSQNYAGTINEVYGHAEEIGYRPVDYMTLAIGHSLDGTVMKPNGVDTNIYFVSKADSMFYGSLTLSF